MSYQPASSVYSDCTGLTLVQEYPRLRSSRHDRRRARRSAHTRHHRDDAMATTSATTNGLPVNRIATHMGEKATTKRTRKAPLDFSKMSVGEAIMAVLKRAGRPITFGQLRRELHMAGPE